MRIEDYFYITLYTMLLWLSSYTTWSYITIFDGTTLGHVLILISIAVTYSSLRLLRGALLDSLK